MNDERFALLGIREGASLSEAHAAYRARVRLCHPDLAVSDEDRRRRTQATIRLNRAYAELRNAPGRIAPYNAPPKVREAPTFVVPAPQFVVKTNSMAWDSILALLGAIVAGIAASTIVGNLPLSVGVMVVVVLVARSGHDQRGESDTRSNQRGPARNQG